MESQLSFGWEGLCGNHSVLRSHRAHWRQAIPAQAFQAGVEVTFATRCLFDLSLQAFIESMWYGLASGRRCDVAVISHSVPCLYYQKLKS